MFSSFDGEFMCGVIVDHFRDGVKWRAVLAQDIAAIFGLAKLHVHETLAAPEKEHAKPLLIFRHVEQQNKPVNAFNKNTVLCCCSMKTNPEKLSI